MHDGILYRGTYSQHIKNKYKTRFLVEFCSDERFHPLSALYCANGGGIRHYGADRHGSWVFLAYRAHIRTY